MSPFTEFLFKLVMEISSHTVQRSRIPFNGLHGFLICLQKKKSVLDFMRVWLWYIVRRQCCFKKESFSMIWSSDFYMAAFWRRRKSSWSLPCLCSWAADSWPGGPWNEVTWTWCETSWASRSRGCRTHGGSWGTSLSARPTDGAPARPRRSKRTWSARNLCCHLHQRVHILSISVKLNCRSTFWDISKTLLCVSKRNSTYDTC